MVSRHILRYGGVRLVVAHIHIVEVDKDDRRRKYG